MRVFVTGATGFIGSRIVPELIGAGHEVVGLTRSEEGARQLASLGAASHHGTLDDPQSLARGADEADAVIHAAFDHDFSRYVENCEKDARVIEALGAVLAGTDRPLLVTSGTAMGSAGPGETAVEQVANLEHSIPRAASEQAAAEVADKGVSVAVVRLPQVHDAVKQGLITFYIEHAREKGVCAYVGDGGGRWCAAHVDDVARLYRLALERHESGARWHAAAEEGVPMREIAAVIGAALRVPIRSLPPEEASAHFGWLSIFAGLDMPASSAWTRERLGWRPTGPSLLDDLQAMRDAGAAARS
ncbi:SDR family oxidoreductase [Methylobacterium oryzisoli]|uniref:SDR family oxidoreductase n=1 Tax=Methylobacterium oryzisoli TaxID=3385502 RepID=UPI0038915F69